MIAQDKPFMGDENAARFKVNKMNKEFTDTYGYEYISIKDYEDKFENGDTDAKK